MDFRFQIDGFHHIGRGVRGEVANPQATVEVSAHAIADGAALIATSNHNAKHGGAAAFVYMVTPTTHFHPGPTAFSYNPA